MDLRIKQYQITIMVLATALSAWASLTTFATTHRYQNTCHNGQRVTIAAVGDILLHSPLQKKAQRKGFMSLWKETLPILQEVDIAFANVEGPMAENIDKHGRLANDRDPDMPWNKAVYSSYPRFNYHPSLSVALKKSGFDVISTANNHSLDRYAIGIDKSVTLLKRVGLQFTGTRARRTQEKWYTLTQRKGITIAWIACTAHTNGIDDHHQQVLYCYKKSDRQKILTLIAQLKKSVDTIIVLPHWGQQYQHQPNQRQRQFARAVLDAGALAVIGGHPHVLQPIEKYRTKDGRETLIAYSLGNFVSYQGSLKNRSTGILLLDIIKEKNHKTVLGQVKLMPAFMRNRSGLNRLGVTLLNSQRHQHTAAYRLIERIIQKENLVFSLRSFYQNPCDNAKR